MTDKINFSRRSALKVAAGSLVASGFTSAASASGKSEIDAMRSKLGTRFSVGEQGAAYTLEDVVPLSPRVRPPFTVGHREPFVLVFRHTDGEVLKGGTHVFTASLMAGEPLMVSSFDGEDGHARLEAVFN